MSLVHTASDSRRYVPGDIDVGPGQLGGTVFVTGQATSPLRQASDFDGRYFYRYVVNPIADIEFWLAPADAPLVRGYTCYLCNYGTGFSIAVKDSTGTNAVITLLSDSLVMLTLVDNTATGWLTWKTTFANIPIPVNISYVDTKYGTNPGLLDRYDAPYNNLDILSADVTPGDVISIRRNTSISVLTSLQSNIDYHSDGITVFSLSAALGSNSFTTGYGNYSGNPACSGDTLFLESYGFGGCTIIGGINYINVNNIVPTISGFNITGGTTYMAICSATTITVSGTNAVELYLFVFSADTANTTLICSNPNAKLYVVGASVGSVDISAGDISLSGQDIDDISLTGDGIANISIIKITGSLTISGAGKNNINMNYSFATLADISGGSNTIDTLYYSTGTTLALSTSISGGTNYIGVEYLEVGDFPVSITGGENYFNINRLRGPQSPSFNVFTFPSGSSNISLNSNYILGSNLFLASSTGTVQINARINTLLTYGIVNFSGSATHSFNITTGIYSGSQGDAITLAGPLDTKNYLTFGRMSLYTSNSLLASTLTGSAHIQIKGRYIDIPILSTNVVDVSGTTMGCIIDINVNKMGSKEFNKEIGLINAHDTNATIRIVTDEAYIRSSMLFSPAFEGNLLLSGRFITTSGSIIPLVDFGTSSSASIGTVILKTCSLIAGATGGPLSATGTPSPPIALQVQGDLVDRFAIDLTKFSILGSVEITNPLLS